MKSLTIFLVPFLLFVLSCSDAGITSYNTAPQAEIILPADDSNFFQGEMIEFKGVVADDQDDAPSLKAEWVSSLDGILNSDPPDTDGRTEFAMNSLSPGSHVITLKVIDSAGSGGEDYITIEIMVVNNPPVIEIIEPSDDQTFTVGETINFILFAEDEDEHDPTESLVLNIESNIDGILITGRPDETGYFTFSYSNLSENTHEIKATVTDSYDLYDEDSITLNIVHATSPPTAAIVSPATGSSFRDGTSVTFYGMVYDNEDPLDTLYIEWSSDRDGIINLTPANSSGEVSFSTSNLSINTHIITLYVEDSDGEYASDSIDITIFSGDDWDDDGDGWTENDGDCDDSDSSINPSMVEICDEIDNNCDGSINEGFGDSHETNDTLSTATDLGLLDAVEANYSGSIHNPTDVDIYTFETVDQWYDVFYIEVTLEDIPYSHDYRLELWKISGDGTGLKGSSDNSGNTTEYIYIGDSYGNDDGGDYAVYIYPNTGYGCSYYTLTINTGDVCCFYEW